MNNEGWDGYTEESISDDDFHRSMEEQEQDRRNTEFAFARKVSGGMAGYGDAVLYLRMCGYNDKDIESAIGPGQLDLPFDKS